jgi:RND family efflux transporter MFP subunit
MACSDSKAAESQQATTTIEDVEIVPIRTMSVQQKNMVHDIVGTGMLASKAEAKLSFKTGGIISKIYVKEGDDVKAGQLLATLDLTEINSQVAQAQLAVEKSERDLQRAKNLYADTVATLETVQNATTGADYARKTLQIAVFNRRFSEIRAAHSGRIIKKLMNEGEWAGPGMPVFFINEAMASNSDWVVRVGVSDRDWASLRVGNTAKVQFDAYPNEVFEGRVTKLADMADPMSGTYEVEVTVNPHGKRFATGLFARVALQPSKSSVMSVIPIEALVEGNGTEGFVYSLASDGNSVLKTQVKILNIGEKEIGVSGLGTVQAVITEGSSYLTEKSRVKLVE